MIFGAGFYSFTLGSLSTLLANLDTRRAHLTHKLMLMDEFCKENKFSKSLKHRVKKALEYISIKTIFSSDDKNQILNEIPTDLRFQIAEMMFNGIFNKIAFFKNKDKCFIANFVPLLNPLKVLQGELIYRKSEYPNLIYFLSNGRVNYVVGPQNIVFKSMVQGSYFGEMEVFDNKARYFTCRAEVDCDLLTIPSDKFASIMESFPDHLTEIKSIIRQRRKQNEIALEKIKSIAPISINSEFWKKKKDVNIYEAVKRKRLRSETSNFNQNIKEATATKDTGNKLKRFFTSIFAKGRASLFKQSSQSQDSDFNNIASPVRGLEVIQKSIPIIKLTKNSSNKDIEINNYSNYNPNAGNNLNTENANLIKEPYKTEFSSNDLLPLNSNHLLMTNRNNSEENNVIQIQSLKETENSQEKTTRNKKKKVTIQFSKEDEEVKPRKSFENSFIYSEGHLKQNLVNNNETNDFINKTEIERGRSKTQTNLQETRNLSMNPLKDKMNIKLTEIKEIEEGDRKRSSSEFKKANLEPRRSSIRKFSTFKNREITNILESFLKSPKLIEKRRKNNRKEKVKKKIIFENELLVLKESVMKQTLNIESNERNIDNIQIQLNQANEYLKMACKRNKIIKKDINFKGFFNRKDTFIVGEKTFVNSDIQKPDLGSQKGNIVLMSEKLHLQEIKDFPEPDNFVLYKNL